MAIGSGQMNENIYQTMPESGRLAENLNLRLEALLERIAPFRRAVVYSYIVDTVEYCEGRLYQTGSGPNFQGGLITLCSCKHMMRAYLDAESWEGTWVAGFTSSRDLGSNKLFYLMMVSQAFESHRDFWLSHFIPDETKTAKAAHLDPFGDIYQPKSESGRPYSYWDYIEPRKDHVHCEPGDWRKDIKYRDRYGRNPLLLTGDPEFSFLWDRPLVASPSMLWRGQRKTSLAESLPSIE